MTQNSITVKRIDLTPDGWRFNILSKRIATITAPDGSRKVSYFGFETETEAKAFKDAILTHSLCTSAVVRPSERLTTVWECKAWGIPTELICYLINRSNPHGSKTNALNFIAQPSD
jgi:hypothetical protein